MSDDFIVGDDTHFVRTLDLATPSGFKPLLPSAFAEKIPQALTAWARAGSREEYERAIGHEDGNVQYLLARIRSLRNDWIAEAQAVGIAYSEASAVFDGMYKDVEKVTETATAEMVLVFAPGGMGRAERLWESSRWTPDDVVWHELAGPHDLGVAGWARREIEAAVVAFDQMGGFVFSRSKRGATNSPTESVRNFTKLTVRGQLYEFNADQAVIIKALWEDARKGGLGIRGRDLCKLLKTRHTTRLRDVFRSDHPAWRTLIVPAGGKGRYRLALD